jgi:hypothetical protein
MSDSTKDKEEEQQQQQQGTKETVPVEVAAAPAVANNNDDDDEEEEDKTNDSNSSSDSSNNDNVQILISTSDRTTKDVLCGRGQPFQVWEGNRTMHRLVDSYRDEYLNARRAEKPYIIKKIIQELRDGGSRFLRPHGDDDWVEVDDESAYHKISHVIRLRKDLPPQHQAVIAASVKQRPKTREPTSDVDMDTKPTEVAVGNLPMLSTTATATTTTANSLGMGTSSLSNIFMGQQQQQQQQQQQANNMFGSSALVNSNLGNLQQQQQVQQTALLQSLLGRNPPAHPTGIVHTTGNVGASLMNQHPLLNQPQPQQQVDLQTLLFQAQLQQQQQPLPTLQTTLHQMLSSRLQEELLLRQQAERQQALLLASMLQSTQPTHLATNYSNQLQTPSSVVSYSPQASQPHQQSNAIVAAVAAAAALLQAPQPDQQQQQQIQDVIATLAREELIRQALLSGSCHRREEGPDNDGQ